ncbi:hypothetical protein NIES2107_27510 [Nostoc carneum NIES-2107]|nr:hypothetical protein NIES2107_27510 [Nostoc carneum NIES-2107]
MTTENLQPHEALELSNQELDEIAGGATTDVFGRNLNDQENVLGYVEIPASGGIKSVTFLQSFYSEQELQEFKQAGINP